MLQIKNIKTNSAITDAIRSVIFKYVNSNDYRVCLTFFGRKDMKNFTRLLASCRDLSRNSTVKVGVLDVPFDKGQGKHGVGDGPKSIRDGGLLKTLKESCGNLDLKDYGALKYKPDAKKEVSNMKNYDQVLGCAKELSDKVQEIINDGRVCLTLGGDHSIGIGSISGHLKSKGDDVGVIWVDAHADINTNKTSQSGNIHGMPLAILCKELAPYWDLELPDWLNPKLSTKNLCYVGLRSVDNYENVFMHSLGINYFDMYDVQRYGIHAVITAALDRIDPNHNKSIHVSFDIDGLDALEAPSTGTPVRGGLLLREGIHIMSTVYKTRRLGVMDLVEVNPHIGDKEDADATVSAAINLISAAFGHHRRGGDSDLKETLKYVKDKKK